MRLEGKKVIVTGGSRGVAAAVTRAYVAEGAIVTIVDVLDELGEKVAEEVTGKGPGKATYRHCDISKREEVEAVFAEAAKEMGGLDVLANIAGVERTTKAEDITDEEYDFIMNINVRGTMLTNQAAFRAMSPQGYGAIINYGSDAGLNPYPGGGHYSASKGAVMAWTRTISTEWGHVGIRANSVVPAIWTPMYDEHRSVMTPEQLAEHEETMKNRIPLGGKLGDPDKDIAPVMVFLASDDSRFINGQIISVNGGLNTVR